MIANVTVKIVEKIYSFIKDIFIVFIIWETKLLVSYLSKGKYSFENMIVHVNLVDMIFNQEKH